MASEKILVVDEDGIARNELFHDLQKAGYSVETCTTVEEAMRLLAVKPLDLVLTEVLQDGYDGMRLLQQMRAREIQTPVIIVTATTDVSTPIAALRNGAFDMLLKPYRMESLLEVVQRGVSYGSSARRDTTYRTSLRSLVKARTSLLQEALLDLERSYDTTLEALGDALDLKDSETEGHSRRVTAYTIALAHAIGVDPADIKTIKHGAFLHDIGKMAIPDAILLKPGRLDAAEQEIMRTHCFAGYQIVRKIPFLRDAAEIVHSHQEHFNGGGYPRRLRGEQIPIGARIFAVADTLDAITSDRPYRKGSTFAAARNEIARCSGTQFDPRVVNTFLAMPPEVWEELRSTITGTPAPA